MGSEGQGYNAYSYKSTSNVCCHPLVVLTLLEHNMARITSVGLLSLAIVLLFVSHCSKQVTGANVPPCKDKEGMVKTKELEQVKEELEQQKQSLVNLKKAFLGLVEKVWQYFIICSFYRLSNIYLLNTEKIVYRY